MVIEDNWISIKMSYGNISFEEYKRKFMLEDVYYNRKLRKELMIDFNMTWEELLETLKKLAIVINNRTESIIRRLEEM